MKYTATQGFILVLISWCQSIELTEITEGKLQKVTEDVWDLI